MYLPGIESWSGGLSDRASLRGAVMLATALTAGAQLVSLLFLLPLTQCAAVTDE